MSKRLPAVAGTFYPDEPVALRAMVRGFLADTDRPPDTDVPAVKALIAPHAGYVYSGPVAGSAYRILAGQRDRLSRVVLLGPSHRVYLEDMAFPSVESFVTPLGEVPIDRALVEQALTLPGTRVMDEAHSFEHCLEVQLPFLQCALDEFHLVPFVVGRCGPGLVADVLEMLWGGEETLIVVSSDLSHYLPYDLAVSTDRRTSDAILARSTGLSGDEACGAHAINGLMHAAIRHGLHVQALDLCNSGDTAGDRRQVVGYGAWSLA